MVLGDLLAQERKTGESHNDFARRAGISPGYLTKMSDPLGYAPPLSTLIAVGRSLRVPDSRIYTWLVAIYPEVAEVCSAYIDSGQVDDALRMKSRAALELSDMLDGLSARLREIGERSRELVSY